MTPPSNSKSGAGVNSTGAVIVLPESGSNRARQRLPAQDLQFLHNRIWADVAAIAFDAVLADEEIVEELHEPLN